jgi:hypothetical protein
MSPRDSVLTGSAGEHYVLYRLHREGILAAQSPAGARDADILVFNNLGVGTRVQVKTRTYGADGGWHMGQKHESMRDPGLVYAFVDMEPEPPVVYVVPSEVVANVVAGSHLAWLGAPGKAGRVHKNHDMRRLRPEYPFELAGFTGRWLDAYRERWDLLTVPASLGSTVVSDESTAL